MAHCPASGMSVIGVSSSFSDPDLKLDPSGVSKLPDIDSFDVIVLQLMLHHGFGDGSDNNVKFIYTM
jgi:hypothetical protein